uniref:Uncharacterized protein n=1 Tax=Anguilla anguilla TaxID=7936 RepID=A0A0E9WWR5_ANGAN
MEKRVHKVFRTAKLQLTVSLLKIKIERKIPFYPFTLQILKNAHYTLTVLQYDCNLAYF